MSDTPFTDRIERETRAELNQAFNDLVLTLLNDLPSQSPQYTGFFASSWKADRSRPQAVDPLESPWTQVKSDKQRGMEREPIIQPRHRTRPKFKFGETAFVGNTANYASYALASPNSNVISYFESLSEVAEMVFSRKPDIRLSTPDADRSL
jgi:hypothetical protein